jgi:hypothetical protein
VEFRCMFLCHCVAHSIAHERELGPESLAGSVGEPSLSLAESSQTLLGNIYRYC